MPVFFLGCDERTLNKHGTYLSYEVWFHIEDILPKGASYFIPVIPRKVKSGLAILPWKRKMKTCPSG